MKPLGLSLSGMTGLNAPRVPWRISDAALVPVEMTGPRFGIRNPLNRPGTETLAPSSIIEVYDARLC
jgi:hypothetical protein